MDIWWHLVTFWGSSENGGDSDEVQDLLVTKVVGIQAAAFAFAAITGYEGQVVSWGEAESGEPVERWYLDTGNK